MALDLHETAWVWVAAVAVGMVVGGFWLVWRSGYRRLALGLGAAAALLLGWAAAPSVAQTVQEIVARAQARATRQVGDAQQLFEATRERHERFLDQAKAVTEGAPAQLKRGFGDLEDTEFAGGGRLATLGEDPPTDGVVYVAVSFSMPPADLRRLGRDAHKAGATLVIRGLVRGSFKETLLAAKRVFDEDSLGGIAIDPNVFRAFDIRAVPTFIAAAGPVQPCAKGLECTPLAPRHDRLSGNITLGEALRLLGTSGEAGAAAANAAGERLGT